MTADQLPGALANPIGPASVDRLLVRALLPTDQRAIDLGCGSGAWLVHALRRHPRLIADGIDADAATIDRARTATTALGLADRLSLHAGDAKEVPAEHRYDLVIAIGLGSIFGDRKATLASCAAHLAPGGRVLYGDAFLLREPDEATRALGEFDSLNDTLASVVDNQWTPIFGHVSTEGEWDAYEWSRSGSLADDNRPRWLLGHRGALSLVTLVLRPTAEMPTEAEATEDQAT